MGRSLPAARLLRTWSSRAVRAAAHPVVVNPKAGNVELFDLLMSHGGQRLLESRLGPGEEGEDALRVVGSLAREGCLATVGMLGEFATDERHIHERLNEYRRAVDALEKQGLEDYRVAVKLTDLGLTLNRELCPKNLEEILLYARDRGRFLEVDMEESPFVSSTLIFTYAVAPISA